MSALMMPRIRVYGNTPRPSFGRISLCRTNLMCNYVSVSSRDRHPKVGHTAKESPTTSGIRNETKPLRVSQTGLWIWSNKCYIVKGWVRSSGTHLISVFQPLEWWLLRKICKFVTTFYLWKFSWECQFSPHCTVFVAPPINPWHHDVGKK